MTKSAIQLLAQKCARGNLRLAHAVDLFVTLYLADAVMLENGNHAKAAKRAGIERSRLIRKVRTSRGIANQIGEGE